MSGDVNFIISATDKTKAVFASVEKGLKGVADKVFSVQGAVAGLAGAAGFGALVKMSADSVDALAKVSDRSHATTQKLAGLQYAAEMTSDVTGEVFVQSLEKMNRKIAEAAIKGGEGADAIKRLGLNASELAGMSMDQQFEAVSEAMLGVSNAGERSYISQKLMEEQGVKLLNTMMLGKDGLADYTAEAVAFGTAVDRVQAAKIEEANDHLTRAGMAVKGVATTVTVELAPYVAAIARHFSDAARESNGFKGEVLSGVEKVTNAVAFMADIWRGLEVVWQGLKVIFWGFIGATLTGLEGLDRAVSTFIDKIPGLEAKPNAALAEWADGARQNVIEAQTELANLALQPMPSEGIKKFFAEVRAEAESSAQKVAAASASMAGGQPMLGVSTDDGKDRDKLAEKLAKLQESLLTENQQLQQHYVGQEFIVEEAFQAGLVTQQERYVLLQELELQHQAKMGDLEAQGILQRRAFEEMNSRQRTSTVLGEVVRMTQGVAQHNKTLFEINKYAAIGQATVDAYTSFNRTMAAYPYPMNIGMAGLSLVASLAQVSAIAGTSFGGGGKGTTPSSAGSAPTVNSVPVQPLASGASQQQKQRDTIVIQGIDPDKMFSGQQLRDLIDRITDSESAGVSFV